MTRAATAKLRVYPALAGLGLIGALALGRPELAALAAPFAVLAGVGLALAQRPELRVHVELDRDRQLEDRTVGLDLELAAERARRSPRATAQASRTGWSRKCRTRGSSGSPRGEQRELEVPVRCVHWGTYRVGEVLWRARDAFGLLVFEGSAGEPRPLKVYPSGETLQRLLQPLETQAFSGNQVARHRGEGIEFADLRPFTTGDRVRRVNWRATAKRGVPWVNEAHPERNTDVVLFLDTFAEARRSDTGTLDLGVRAAASFATHYLKEKDRVGLVSFGGVLNWLTAASGTTQLYRIVDSLLDAEILLSYAWKDLDVIPTADAAAARARHRAQPAARRAGRGLAARPAGARLRPRRDRALAVLRSSRRVETETEQLAYRLWRLRRDALRSRYASLGVPIVEWREGVPLDAMVEEVRAFRRHARVVRVVVDRCRRAARQRPASRRIQRCRTSTCAGLRSGSPVSPSSCWPSGSRLARGPFSAGASLRSVASTQCSSPPRHRARRAHASSTPGRSSSSRSSPSGRSSRVFRPGASRASSSGGSPTSPAVSAGAAAVAGLVLVVAAASGGGGAALEAIGVAATIGALGLVAVLVRRSATEVDSGP